MIIDSHAHLGSDAFDQDRDAVIKRAEEAGIGALLNIATDAKSLFIGEEISNKFPWIYLAGSTTPHDVATLGEKDFSFFEKTAREKKMIAIGETGLDYYYEHSPKELQKEFCRRYFRLAKELSLPVIIHCREAFSDLIELLDRDYSKEGRVLPGVLHCFTGTKDEAKALLERGFYISFSGIVTFKKSTELQKVLDIVPIKRLLIETDAPYLAPHPLRGKRNEPAFITHTAAFIAARKNMPFDAFKKQMQENFKELFKIR